MSMIIQGKVVDLIATILAFLVCLYYIFTKKEKMPYIKRMPGLEAIDEGIGRSIEMGRPICWTNMQTTLGDERAPEVLAGLSVLSYMAEQTAQKGARLIATFEHADIYPIVEATMNDAYKAAGVPELFDVHRDILYMPVSSYAMDMLDLAYREKPGTLICIGRHHYPVVLVSEVYADIGAFQVMGTGQQWTMTPFMISACDYTLFGEEIFVAGAYLVKNLEVLYGILGEEWMKWFIILLMIGGAIMLGLGFDIKPFLNM